MPLLKLFFLGWMATLLFCACGDGDSEIEELAVPVFKSSFPADNATDIGLTSDIRLTFDEVITLASSHGITVNNERVDVSVLPSSTYVKILLPLESNKEYTVKVPAGAVINSKGVSSNQSIEFSFSTLASIAINIDAELVTPNPSSEAVRVYNFLKENYGKKIISSTMANVNWNFNEAEWVYEQTGKYPAINTFDYIHLPFSPANWIDYSQTEVAENWWSNNGLISAGWHWLVPKFEGTDYSTDDYTYSPEETTFKTSNVTIDGTWENIVAKADLEKIVGYLKLLQAKNIPVIWRPLHEAAGNTYEYTNGEVWFWWGSDGAEAYKNLWVYMFNYFEDQGLNNLIWVWTTQTKDNDFYPGDDYVDIVGRDIYNNSESTSIADEFNTIQQTYPSKMIALSECGGVANISNQWSAGAGWSYFMPWYDYERTNDSSEADFNNTDHEHANAAWWIDAFGSENVLTRNDMPDW